MRYYGGKYSIAKRIMESILSDTSERRIWFEPFCGGANVTVHAARHFSELLCFDACPDLILMWQELQNHWTPPDISPERYEHLKDTQPSAERAFAAFGASYGGAWFAGYSRQKSNRTDRQKQFTHVYQQTREAVLKQVKYMPVDLVKFECAEFGKVNPPDGAVVYCDPPYSSATRRYEWDIDYTLYLETLQQWSKRCDVYCSEYEMPAGEVIAEFPKQKSIQGDGVNVSEKLYKIRGDSCTDAKIFAVS